MLLVVLACTTDEPALETLDSGYTVIYKGSVYRTESDFKKLENKGGITFNDFVKNPNLDYLFDTEEELLTFVNANYSAKDVRAITNHVTGKTDDTNTSARTLSWGGFGTVQWTQERCDEFITGLCNGYPSGRVNDFTDTDCGFLPGSFNASVPTGESITMTYYKMKNCVPAFGPCPSTSYSVIFFSAGSHCFDVKYRPSCSRPLFSLGYANSAKWTATNQ